MPRLWHLAALALVALSCGPARPPSASRDPAELVPRDSPKTLVLITRTEPETLAGTPITAMTTSTAGRRRLFNAALALLDGDNRPLPYLAEALPQLNTDSWRLFPDGRMETTYRLRPNLTWHDGAPLTAEDFAFAWRVYTTPELGRASSEPINLIEDVTAADGAVVVRWRAAYADAGALQGVLVSGNTGPSFAPLPRHILERSFNAERASLASQPYFTVEYVGAGPYRLDRWEPGASVEGVAFDQHVLGHARIERVRLVFSPDGNTVLANIMAGEAHLAIDDSLRIQAGIVLKRDWDSRGAGRVEFKARTWRVMEFQYRPELANPSAVMDGRVRKALAHAIDKQAINEGLYEGVGIPADTMFHPTVDFFPALDAAVTKYPLDLRRADALMTEAGYRRGPDGLFLAPAGGRMVFEVTGTQSPENSTERTILVDGWRRAGFEAEQAEFTAQEIRDGQRLSSFRSMYSTGSSAGIASLVRFKSDNISGPENRWTRSNRGGWSDAEYDRRVDAVMSTLDRDRQPPDIIAAVKILTEQAGALSLYFNPAVVAFPAAIVGMDLQAADAEATWNIHQWELR